MNIQDVYDQAASVAQQSGVDPSIIATIASTESNLALAPPFTLGITTQASRGGAGSSGQTLSSGSPYAGTSQPAAFWAYNDGAEAAIAFAQYIAAYQSELAPLLSQASAFFDPSGPIIHSNYYVPTPGGTSAADYYGHWQAVAASLGGGGVAIATQPLGSTRAGLPTFLENWPVPVLVGLAAVLTLWALGEL